MSELSRRELRKFGLTVGIAFALFGTVSWWRGHELPPKVLWTLGALLVVPGLLAPALLRPVERVWMRAALVLGYVNTRILLTAAYYIIVTPIGAALRLFRDPLDRALDDGRGSRWVKRPIEPVDPARYRQQF